MRKEKHCLIMQHHAQPGAVQRCRCSARALNSSSNIVTIHTDSRTLFRVHSFLHTPHALSSSCCCCSCSVLLEDKTVSECRQRDYLGRSTANFNKSGAGQREYTMINATLCCADSTWSSIITWSNTVFLPHGSCLSVQQCIWAAIPFFFLISLPYRPRSASHNFWVFRFQCSWVCKVFRKGFFVHSHDYRLCWISDQRVRFRSQIDH